MARVCESTWRDCPASQHCDHCSKGLRLKATATDDCSLLTLHSFVPALPASKDPQCEMWRQASPHASISRYEPPPPTKNRASRPLIHNTWGLVVRDKLMAVQPNRDEGLSARACYPRILVTRLRRRQDKLGV